MCHGGVVLAKFNKTIQIYRVMLVIHPSEQVQVLGAKRGTGARVESSKKFTIAPRSLFEDLSRPLVVDGHGKSHFTGGQPAAVFDAC